MVTDKPDSPAERDGSAEQQQPDAPDEVFSAYWYSFNATGCEPIDKILKEVARSGKRFHSTEEWGIANDNAGARGESCEQAIQRVAQEAAGRLEAAEKEITRQAARAPRLWAELFPAKAYPGDGDAIQAIADYSGQARAAQREGQG